MSGIGEILGHVVSDEAGWGQACQDWRLALRALEVVPPLPGVCTMLLDQGLRLSTE